MTVSRSVFGEHEGKQVDQFRLVSDTGVEVDIISYGVVVRDWRVPVAGGLRSVVLGFESFAPYPVHSPHFGSLAGRVANRIGGSRFTLEGREYVLPSNENGNHLHGGPGGLGRQVWEGEVDDAGTGVRFTHFSPDGAMGYPGNVTFTAHYTLSGNRLRLALSAETDRLTPISLVQHQYFNLGTTDTIIDHRYRIAASAFTEPGPQLLPTGAILPVAGTKYDFRTPRVMRDADGSPQDFDVNLVLDTGRDAGTPVAEVVSPDADLTLRLFTDRPGVQLYNAVYTDIPVPGLEGRRYGKHAGFCLEDQSFADAVHNPHFPSILHSPDRPYRHWCEIEIG
ncbi:galactose mutarotase [Arsenicitalea aurantiaca]|uniref:Aldose 1-epimerase n=1 Tax=Arsenicitalea aurantiaca TaxID=1783274 RepID=A0A433X803_9HYPH|nr:aldose epimerase family protein [Arsenicitalea aurantiaca]RUT30189.1 galactose mutarotase [Arsenicitalea aurantiaca]